MKKLKIFLGLGLLAMIFPSCVFSLFPIYTPETLVFLPELTGKWHNPIEDLDTYIEFLPYRAEKIRSENEDKLNDRSTYSTNQIEDSAAYVIAGQGWSIKSNNPIEIEQNGMIITDTLLIKNYYDSLFMGTARHLRADDEQNSSGTGFLAMMRDLGKMMNQFAKGLQGLEDQAKGVDRSPDQFAYLMRDVDEGEVITYKAFLVRIGTNYFLDIYPTSEDADNGLMVNLFPVHTFMKVGLEGNRLNITPFDLEKLNELFKSNLIRLRHEYVDGNVLITAQPEEIQKFIMRYANDESVFEETDTFTKLIQ